MLDLYAGSGAVGLESLSRGAARATLVEHDKRTAALIRDNADVLGMRTATVHPATVSTFLMKSGPTEATYDVVFLDPPYSLEVAAVDRDLASLVSGGWLGEDSLVVVERSSRAPAPTWPVGLEALRSRRYGETVLWYGRADSPAPEEPAPDHPASEEP